MRLGPKVVILVVVALAAIIAMSYAMVACLHLAYNEMPLRDRR